MKSHSLHLVAAIFFLLIILTGCNMPATSVATQKPDLVYTETAKTASAFPTYPSVTTAPTIIITQAPPAPTDTAVPTSTPTTKPSPTATVTTTPTLGACSNDVDFIDDVTIPDNSELLPGQAFTKTWRLKNAGTCTWTTLYSVVFITGDQMSGVSPTPLVGTTLPGATVDVSVSLKAPGTLGTFRGDWQLQDNNGNKFGTGTKLDQPFYVQVKVVEGISELNLGSPTWSDTMDTADSWYLLDTENTKFTEGDGALVLKSILPGKGEEWGLSNRPAAKDYYLQATFITGNACSGLDKYGLLGRAPGPNEGYVFEFSCDGRFRLYTWDGTNYAAVQEWRSASPIKSGANQTNIMGLWMEGNTIRLFANGYKIGEYTDNMFDEGQFGLVIGSVKTENFTVSVDLVEYWELNK